MMKLNLRLLLIGCLALGATACSDKYPSRVQAKEACDEWASKGKTIDWEIPIPEDERKTKVRQYAESLRRQRVGDWIISPVSEEDLEAAEAAIKNPSGTETGRWCFPEKETTQYLGYENKFVQNGEWVKGENEGEGKVVKHFRY